MSVVLQTQENDGEIKIAFADCACLKALQDYNGLQSILISRRKAPAQKEPKGSLVFVGTNRILHHYVANSRDTLINSRTINHNLVDFIETYEGIVFSQGGNKITVTIPSTEEHPEPIRVSTDTEFVRHCHFHIINPKHIPNSIYWYYDPEP